jgi:hypothetical protein
MWRAVVLVGLVVVGVAGCGGDDGGTVDVRAVVAASYPDGPLQDAIVESVGVACAGDLAGDLLLAMIHDGDSPALPFVEAVCPDDYDRVTRG